MLFVVGGLVGVWVITRYMRVMSSPSGRSSSSILAAHAGLSDGSRAQKNLANIIN